MLMWQEVRKQEKKIRGMIVDYKRRAERRKDYYEKIKAEPTQFIQVHGRPCKIHLDPAIAVAADSPATMMPWQGNEDIMIDRFDVRAHLDFIPDHKPSQEDDDEPSQEERFINYERYRILAQNDFLTVNEEKFLQQLAIEEQFGPVEKIEPQPIEGKKKVIGAAIGYNYNEGGSSTAVGPMGIGVAGALAAVVSGGGPGGDEKSSESEKEEEDDDDDSDIDFDMCVDINKITSAQAHEMNNSALAYGMVSNDFFSFLTKDVEEAENMKLAREREEEKAMFSGRKSRRERRAFREKKLIGRKLSPPSYAASQEPIVDLIRTRVKSRSRTRSRSASPPNAGMIQYITSFGGDEAPLEPPPPQAVKTSVHRSKQDSKYKRTVRYKSTRSPEPSFSRGPVREYRPRSRSRSRSRGASRQTSDSGRRLRSRSRSPSRRTRSPIARVVRYRSKSRSRSPHTSASYRRKRSSSKSRSKSPTIRIVKKRSPTPQPVRSIEVPAPPVITRYYGRRKNESSSSELDLSDSDEKSDKTSDKLSVSSKNSQAVGNAGGRTKPLTQAAKISLQERLKKKRQALINRQYKADKRAERARLEKVEQERQDRDEEMREISIKMRRRERQKRHQYYDADGSNQGDNSDEDEMSNASGSGSENGSGSEQKSQHRNSRRSKDEDKDRSKSSRDRDRSRGREPRRERERSGDRESHSRTRDEDRHKHREKSRERGRERSRDHERNYRRDKEGARDWSKERERDRYHSHRAEEDEGSSVSIKRPFRPLVDY